MPDPGGGPVPILESTEPSRLTNAAVCVSPTSP
jgi:hypothetical protein